MGSANPTQVAPAQELQKVLQQQRAAKTRKVSSTVTKRQRANPDTAAGLVITADVLKKLAELDADKEALEAAKQQRAATRKQKGIDKNCRARAAQQRLIPKWLAARQSEGGSHAVKVAIQMEKVSVLRDVFTALNLALPTGVNNANNMRKPDIMAALEQYIAERPLDASAGEALGQGTEGEEQDARDSSDGSEDDEDNMDAEAQ